VSSSVNKSLPAKKAGNILNKPRGGDGGSSGAASSSAGGGSYASGNNNEASDGGPPAAVLSVSTTCIAEKVYPLIHCLISKGKGPAHHPGRNPQTQGDHRQAGEPHPRSGGQGGRPQQERKRCCAGFGGSSHLRWQSQRKCQ